jgi:signal transduction histidine kinase
MKRVAAGIRRLQRRASGSLTLSQRFLVVAAAVVAVAMLVLGGLINNVVTRGTTEGMAATAVNTIETLLGQELADPIAQQPLAIRDENRIAELFQIGSDTNATRLLQIRIYDLDGRAIYASGGQLTPLRSAAEVMALAKGGVAVTALKTIDLAPVGPLQSLPLHALEILTPVWRPATHDIVAVAELEYSAEQVELTAHSAEVQVWVLVGIVGIILTGVLYVFVESGSRVIAAQRRRLRHNLAGSRALSARIRDLHAASENLRVSANLANEQLLAFVGSEIHDGPIQLLTLLILRLTGDRRGHPAGIGAEAGSAETIQIATKAIEDLRSISSGLVLPEVADISLEQVIDLAVSRHHSLTGVLPRVTCGILPGDLSLELKTCAYRIVQEALNNAFRHGEPDGQLVTANLVDRDVIIEIVNRRTSADRVGDRPQGATPLGLVGMKFRAESVGGSLSIHLADPSTARIIARLPAHSGAGVGSVSTSISSS